MTEIVFPQCRQLNVFLLVELMWTFLCFALVFQLMLECLPIFSSQINV
jgi:hypothetical protein